MNTFTRGNLYSLDTSVGSCVVFAFGGETTIKECPKKKPIATAHYENQRPQRKTQNRSWGKLTEKKKIHYSLFRNRTLEEIGRGKAVDNIKKIGPRSKIWGDPDEGFIVLINASTDSEGS